VPERGADVENIEGRRRCERRGSEEGHSGGKIAPELAYSITNYLNYMPFRTFLTMIWDSTLLTTLTPCHWNGRGTTDLWFVGESFEIFNILIFYRTITFINIFEELLTNIFKLF
jgi:hypothetical protein